MGLQYTYVLVGPAAGIDGLLHAIGARLSREDRERLEAALPWRPEVEQHGIGGMVVDAYEHENSYCFSFCFEPDAELCAYEAAHPSLAREDALVRVGCIWTSVHGMPELVVVEATAATSSMSRLLEQSASVREAFRAMARAGGAHALFLDTEDRQTCRLLHPEERDVAMPEEGRYDDREDDRVVCIETYYLRALELAGVTVG